MENEESSRFEMPIDPKTLNVFAIDDYLRMLSDPIKRKSLVSSLAGNPAAMTQYEDENDLPQGAVELAMMIDDQRVREMVDRMSKAYAEAKDSPEKFAEAVSGEMSLQAGISRLYPNAQRFLTAYHGRILRTSSQNVVASEMLIFRRDACTLIAVCVFAIIFALYILNLAHIANALTVFNANTNVNLNLNLSKNLNVNGNGNPE